MPDFTYDIAAKRLCLSTAAGTRCWGAVTGPWGNGALPPGKYRVLRRGATEYSSASEAPYRDKSGKGFFIPIKPLFSTTRTGLGIHPDGNVSGTQGCIGLTDPDTSSFYQAFGALPFDDLDLEVKCRESGPG